MFKYTVKLQEMIAKGIDKFLTWHTDFTDDIRWRLDLTWYHMTWLAFIKGIILVLLLQWIF